MNDTVQRIIIVAAVIGAVVYLVLRARSKKSGKGGCGCGKKDPLK